MASVTRQGRCIGDKLESGGTGNTDIIGELKILHCGT